MQYINLHINIFNEVLLFVLLTDYHFHDTAETTVMLNLLLIFTTKPDIENSNSQDSRVINGGLVTAFWGTRFECVFCITETCWSKWFGVTLSKVGGTSHAIFFVNGCRCYLILPITNNLKRHTSYYKFTTNISWSKIYQNDLSQTITGYIHFMLVKMAPIELNGSHLAFLID